MGRPKGSKNKKPKIDDIIVIQDEIPAPEKNGTFDDKPCQNCEDGCEGQKSSKWHYGSPNKWCNKCKCLALKQ